MGRRSRYPQELRERAVRMVHEHRNEYPSEWAAITSIAGKLGVGTEALRLWLRRANEILKAAWAFFARYADIGITRVIPTLRLCRASAKRELE